MQVVNQNLPIHKQTQQYVALKSQWQEEKKHELYHLLADELCELFKNLRNDWIYVVSSTCWVVTMTWLQIYIVR